MSEVNLTLAHGCKRLFLLAITLGYICLGQQEKDQSPSGGCTVGPSAPTKSLSSLTLQQLADGILNLSAMNTWDFGVPAGALQATPGQPFTMACLIAVNVSVSRPNGSRAFLQPTALDLSNATGLSMEHVLLSTNCSSVLEYQSYFCGSYDVAGSLSLRKGAVYFASWRDGFTSLRNVTLTCAAGESPPQPPCWLTSAQTAAELRDAFMLYAYALAEPSTIVVAGNISLTNSSWPATPVEVNSDVRLVGSARLYRPVLDFQLRVMLADLLSGMRFYLTNLTCVNLAPTYISPAIQGSIFALLAERVWAFKRSDRQLHISESTLVVPAEELRYMKYWLTYRVSPVPEDQAKAAWLNIIDLQVSKVNESGVYYKSVLSYTTKYADVRLTDSLAGYPLIPVRTGLQQFLTAAVPLTAVRQVINVTDLLIALAPSTMLPDPEGRRWLILVANISLADDGSGHSNSNRNATAVASANSSAAADSVRLPGSTVIGIGAGLSAVRLDFGGRLGAVEVPSGSALVLRMLVLGGLPARSAAYDSRTPLEILSSPLWGVELEDGTSNIRLESCTVLVSNAELWLLQQALLASGAAPAAPAPPAPLDDALRTAVRAFFTASHVTTYNTTHLGLGAGATDRYTFSGLTFRTAVAADGEADGSDIVAPPGPGGGGNGGSKGWKLGVIVSCTVGVPVLVLAVTAAVLAARRRRQPRDAACSSSSQEAYDKYIRRDSVVAPGGPGGSGGAALGSSLDLVNASNELTNSSHVLRPDARQSRAEAQRLKATGSGNASASASASGGIGVPGRSTSTTGAASPDTSSIAVQLPSGSGGAGAASSSASGGVSGAVRPPSASAVVAAAATATADGGLVTDSFERPPSSTVLGQHGPGGRHAQRLASVGAGSSSSVLTQSQSILATGGAGALEQMHQMIQMLGRDFNDKQLEVQGLLGKGAHGTVYRGTWRGLPVAVKSMIVSSESSARQQSRVLMEAAISSNLAHPNIVTTYAYELREVEHELAALSPELARQGGGWRLLIIMEYCDAGPLRRLVDCGFFLPPPKPAPPPCGGARPKLKLPAVGLMRKDSPSERPAEGGSGSRVEAGSGSTAAAAAAAATSCSRGSSSSDNGNGRASPVDERLSAAGPGAVTPRYGTGGSSGPAPPPPCQSPHPHPHPHLSAQAQRPPLDPVPADVPGRPSSSLQAARRYVEAALLIARGLQHIHDKNIVHGDLNPNNVLLVRAPGTPLGFCPKVADFGLSVRMAEGESHMSNLFQGSPYYCAPEVVLSGKIGKSSDIYSLGIMLWELQNGTRPLWRAGVRLRSYPSLNTAELEFGPETPPRYVRLARDCFHASKDARPVISFIVDTLVGVRGELDAL